jgi:hypothetical protein
VRAAKVCAATIVLMLLVVVPAGSAWAGFASHEVYSGLHGSASSGIYYTNIEHQSGVPVVTVPEHVTFTNSAGRTQVTLTGAIGAAPVMPQPLPQGLLPTSCVPSGLSQVTCITMSAPLALPPLIPGFVPWYGPFVGVEVVLTGPANVLDGRALTVPFGVNLTYSPGGNVVYLPPKGSADVSNGAADTVYCAQPTPYVTADPIDTLIGC